MEKILVTSVDFGSKKISAALGRGGEEDIDILGSVFTQSKGIEKGFIIDRVKCSEAFKVVINELERVTKEKITDIYAGISSRDLRLTEVSASINLKDGKVSSKDIKRAIDRGKINVTLADGEEIVDIVINYYTLDGKVVYENVIGWMGSTLSLDLTVILGPTKELSKFQSVIKENGYNFKGFVVNIIAGKKIFIQGKRTIGTNVLVDIGSGTSDIALFNNGALKYINSIPVGGNNVTKDLSICGKFSMSEAETIKNIYSSNYETLYNDNMIEDKIDVGSLKISKTLFYNVTMARLEELLKYVNLELKKTSYFDGICSIIIYGDGISYYENINDIAKSQIEKRTKIITKDYLGMKNQANITSLAVVKEVYDRLELVYEDSIKIEVEKRDVEKSIDEKANVKKEQQGLFGKFKSFLEDIF